MEFSQPRYCEAYCPDPNCYERLCFEAGAPSIRCFYCGQTFTIGLLNEIKSIDYEEARPILRRVEKIPDRKGADWTSVNGVSSFYFKLVSHLITDFGTILSQSANQNQKFDSREFAECAFLIGEADLLSYGFGRDSAMGENYLSGTLTRIKAQNNNVEVLVPLDVTGSDNCLLYSISRALVGRELLWHPLRISLREHLVDNNKKYKELFGDFLAGNDWAELVNECDLFYSSMDKLGLRNAHIFALANLLCRPIVLLDCDKFMKLNDERSVVFLPALQTVKECKNAQGILNKPLVIAWASIDHNRFVPLVAVEGRPMPRLARSYLPKAWCVGDDRIEQYISFTDNFCHVASGKTITKSYCSAYIDKLESKYFEVYCLSAKLVCLYCENASISLADSNVFNPLTIQHPVFDCLNLATWKLLKRCLVCWRLVPLPFPNQRIYVPGNDVYKNLKAKHQPLKNGGRYETETGVFEYNSSENCFFLVDLFCCIFCKSMSLRSQLANGDVLYENGDHTRIPAPLANCKRKMKHFLNGLLLDNLPSSFTNDAKVACTDPLWSYTDHPEFDIFAKFDKEEMSCVPITSTMQSPGWTTVADVNLHVTFESGAESDIMLFNAKTDAGSLVGVICSEFSLLPRQVDRIVYLSEYDCSLSFPNDFQNCTGILIFLVEIDQKSSSKSCTPASRIASSNDLEQLYVASAGTNRFWKTILKQPEMFRRNGVIYKMLSKDQTLVDGYHYSITSLMEYAFVYCKLKNRFELCINKVGHFEASDRLEDDLLRRQTLTNETNIMNALIDLNKPTPTYPYSSSVMNFKDNYQMCYFLKK